MLGSKNIRRRLGEETRQPLGLFPITMDGNGTGAGGSAKVATSAPAQASTYRRRANVAVQDMNSNIVSDRIVRPGRQVD